MLISSEGADAAELPETMRRADVFCYQGRLPMNNVHIQTDLAVCFCSVGDAPGEDVQPPCGAVEQIVPICEGSRSFMTRGDGNVILSVWK